MTNETKLKPSQKVIIGLLIALLFLAGILTLAYKYMESFGQTSRILNTNPVGQSSIEEMPSVDLERLTTDYLNNRNQIVNEFLILTELRRGEELASSARTTQSQLLNLVLPEQYRETHLTIVLLLSEISELANSGNEIALNNKIEVLKNLISD